MPESLKAYLRRICDLKGLAFAVALFVIYTACLYHLLPEGINKEFSQKAHEKGAVVLGVLLAVIWLFRKKLPPVSLQEVFDKGHAFLLLLPLTPIMQYTLLNQDILTMPASLAFVAIHAGIAFVFILAVPYLLRKRVPLAASTVVATALLYFYFNMSILAADYHWIHEGEFPIQVAIFLLIFGALSLSYPFRHPFLYAMITVFFAANTGFALFMDKQDGEAIPHVRMARSVYPYETVLLSKKFHSTPDIYMLVFDSYVGNETMLQYGIDNSAQEKFLKEHGFHIYPDTYSLGRSSLNSISRMLNISPVNGDEQSWITSGRSTMARLLRDNGYKVYDSLFGHFFGKHNSAYDQLPGAKSEETARSAPLASLLQASAEGQFRFDIGDIGATTSRIQKKRDVIALQSQAPKFLYNHTGPHHSQNSGKCLPNETALFKERLDKANEEMRGDINLIDSMDRDAIVIVMGDHGPYLTGDCFSMKNGYTKDDITRLHVQDRFGAFIAIRWPEHNEARIAKDDIRTLQDIFPAILARLYQDDAILEHRLPPVTQDSILGVRVENGIIKGGANDGEPLFVTGADEISTKSAEKPDA